MFELSPFRPSPDSPLYQQLYRHLRSAILSGELKGGTKLPSSRALADEMGVSRNTVREAFESLRAEGYLESSQGSGTFVAEVLPEDLIRAPRPRRDAHVTALVQPQLSRRARSQLTEPLAFAPFAPASGLVCPFRLGVPALDAFPHKLWSRLIARQARRAPQSALWYQDPAGYRPLREAIAAHVTVTRQVRCTPEQVIIVAGTQGGLDLASRLLVGDGDAVWVEDPGYFGARGALLGVGATLVPVPVDAEGLVVDVGSAHAPHARLACVTPSHQFPLGMTMSASRRLALLEWAKRADAYILEDDYDGEYRYTGRPIAALQGLDEAGRVIYVGTFSKVLFPALRLGFLIVPLPLVEAFLRVRRFVDAHPPILEQRVLTDFMVEGHFTRHLRRMRTLYSERRAVLLELARELPLDIDAPGTGLHCIGWLPEGVDDRMLVRRAKARGLELWTVSAFSLRPLERQGVILGYGGQGVTAIKDGMRRLSAALADLEPPHRGPR